MSCICNGYGYPLVALESKQQPRPHMHLRCWLRWLEGWWT